MRQLALSGRRIVTLLLAGLALSACTVKLIADYDQETDRAVTALQRRMARHLIDIESKLGTPKAEYAVYVEEYKELRVDVSALELRVNALPQNSITQEQIAIVHSMVETLEELHKEGFGANTEGSREVLKSIQKDFDTALAAILKLELAKKRDNDAGGLP